MYTLTLNTAERTQMIEITREVQGYVSRSKISSGSVLVFVPHTTAACTIQENADPDVVTDIIAQTTRMVPFESNYRHAEGNSAAHIKAILFGASEHILIENGRLVLGTWQGIYFCEFDGPRSRKVHLSVSRVEH